MFRNFFKDESGQGMVEYGLIIALISIAAIVALKVLAPKLTGIFNKAETELENATKPASPSTGG